MSQVFATFFLGGAPCSGRISSARPMVTSFALATACLLISWRISAPHRIFQEKRLLTEKTAGNGPLLSFFFGRAMFCHVSMF